MGDSNEIYESYDERTDATCVDEREYYEGMDVTFSHEKEEWLKKIDEIDDKERLVELRRMLLGEEEDDDPKEPKQKVLSLRMQR